VNVFEPGERVMLVDQRDRTYLMTLQAGGTYHTHSGTLPHDDLLGKPEGTRVETSKGMVMMAFRPRFADFVLKMPRGAQVVYPKDLGPIMMYADIFPGSRVLEAGTGSGVVTSDPAGIECGATCSAQIGAPTKVVLHAIPAVGSTFAGWSGEGCKGVRNCRVTMNEARNVTATFSKEVTPPPPGLLTVKSPIRVKGRKALLRVSCHKGPCRGTLRLIARVRNAKGRARRVQIGRSSVKLRAGVSSTLGMRLSRTGISLLRRAGRLRVQVVGGGTVPHRVKLSLRRR